jgi:hypothetical protein
VLVDVILEALSGNGVVTLIKLLDIAIRVKLVLTLELVKSLDVIVKWLNRFLERLADLVEGIPKPDVLIWEELFVVGVFRLAFRFISRTEGSLEHLLSMSLEQVSQKDGLQLGDLLKALDTLVKDLKNFAYNVAGLNGVGRDQLVWLEDQIKDEEGLGILILGEHGIKLFPDFLDRSHLTIRNIIRLIGIFFAWSTLNSFQMPFFEDVDDFRS